MGVKTKLVDPPPQVAYDLNTHIDHVPEMYVQDALRELTQNLVDEVAKRNGERRKERNPTLKGLKIARSSVRGASVTVFHDDHVRYAEIVKKEREIRFINFGTVISSVEDLTRYGKTTKRDVSNQIGQHGEGFCHAMLVFARNDINVHCKGFFRESQTEVSMRGYHFKLNDSGHLFRKPVAYRQADRKEFSHFEVVLTLDDRILIYVDEDIEKFSIFDFIVPPESIRDRSSSSEDAGFVIFDETQSGRLFNYNFLVEELDNVKFGYNFFFSKISRDRNVLSSKSIIQGIAECWSKLICESSDRADAFLELISDERVIYFEHHAIEGLSLPAKNKLADAFQRKYGFKYPVDATEKSDYFINPIEVSKMVINAISACSEGEECGCKYHTTDCVRQKAKRLLTGTNSITDNVHSEVLDMLNGTVNVTFEKFPESLAFLKLFKVPGVAGAPKITPRIIINSDAKFSAVEMVSTIAFKVLPKQGNDIFRSAVDRVIERERKAADLRVEEVRSQMIQPSPDSPLRPEPELEESSGESGSDNEGESGSSSGSSSSIEEMPKVPLRENKRGLKRDREPDSAISIDSLPDAPRGFKWSKVWALRRN
jgi:hypothetical protein